MLLPDRTCVPAPVLVRVRGKLPPPVVLARVPEKIPPPPATPRVTVGLLPRPLVRVPLPFRALKKRLASTPRKDLPPSMVRSDRLADQTSLPPLPPNRMPSWT